MTRDELIQVAARRGVVRLTDGRTCRLTYWPPAEPDRAKRRGRATLQSGAYISIAEDMIAAVIPEAAAGAA